VSHLLSNRPAVSSVQQRLIPS